MTLVTIVSLSPLTGLSAMNGANPGASSDPQISLRLILPDGHTWRLAPGGMGRPFIVRFLLINHSGTPVHLWDPDNSEGSQNPSVILTASDGTGVTLTPPPVERSGVATSITIGPDKTFSINLELLRLIGDKSLPPGAYSVKGIYENHLGDRFRDIWTGRIESDRLSISIVR